MYLIVNENGSDNIGDHAINEGLQAILDELEIPFHSAPFASVSFKGSAKRLPVGANSGTANLKVKAKRLLTSNAVFIALYWFLKNLRRVTREVSDPKVSNVLIGGGQLILSGSTFPIAMFTWTLLSNLYKKPLYLVGVGCGETFGRFESFLMRSALKRAENIFVREAESIEKLNSLFGVNAAYCPDLAFGLAPLSGVDKKNRLVVGVTDFEVYRRYRKEVGAPVYSSKEEYLRVWQDRLLSLLPDSNTEIVFASTTLKDVAINTELYMLMSHSGIPNKLVNIDKLHTLLEYREILATAKLIFSGRMHSLILGKIEGCVLQPWLISKKLVFFMQNYKDADIRILQKKIETKITELP